MPRPDLKGWIKICEMTPTRLLVWLLFRLELGASMYLYVNQPQATPDIAPSNSLFLRSILTFSKVNIYLLVEIDFPINFCSKPCSKMCYKLVVKLTSGVLPVHELYISAPDSLSNSSKNEVFHIMRKEVKVIRTWQTNPKHDQIISLIQS